MEDFPIVVVGSGFSGIAMGVLLKRAGIESFTILEKAGDIGGTWRDNTYPGAACDVPSHLYCYSFEPKPDWSRAFSPQQEIQEYLRHCVEKYGLGPHLQFHKKVSGAEFDESSGTWTVQIEDAESLRARALVLGNGALHVPAYPEIPGRESFEGRLFHSAEWDHSFDLRGKRVAVIGTGASSIQFVPEIAPQVEKLQVFQRTPPWIAPKPDGPISESRQSLFRRFRPLHWLHRAWIYWTLELRAVGFVVDPRLLKLLEKLLRRYLAHEVKDRELRRKLTPSYTLGCKRILLSNDYYQALQRPNVELVTEPIARITPKGIQTRDGVEHPADAIICGTGFMVGEYLTHLNIVGRHGRTLEQAVAARAGTYLGITVHGFPNLYLMMGPNTGLGHNSMIFMIEAQARHALQAIQTLRRRRLRFLDVLASAQARMTERLQGRMRRSVWSSGCHSWYMDEDGYNGTLWPYFTFQYWWRTRRLALGDFEAVAERD
ncbi:MAG TPA: NAD(P)/FAD-dependent oxidoreductase [Myxococcota bacterium]|nr:NAD(P)/FAD-dependent oxidoreductase [Myxococcota bacterium]